MKTTDVFPFDVISFGAFLPSFLTRASFAAFLTLSLAFSGCGDRGKTLQHGAGQVATAQEKELQNRNLIEQVVQAAERQENYPDRTYLRGALGRLNTWLAEKPVSIDFDPDPEYDALAADVANLVATSRRADELVKLFVDESKQPTEKDGAELQEILSKAKSQIDPLAETFKSSALREFGLFIDDLSSKLSGAKEFQFADATETFQTQIRQFVKEPTYRYYNFETLTKGLDDFARLLKIDGQTFLPQDADYLREVVWFRDVFTWAKGAKQDDLTIALSLFDWTVKNVVLAPPLPGQAGFMKQLAWQTLLTGQGSAMDRAIVFIELLRQHRLDAFVLRPEGETPENFPLVVGVRLNDEVYLFLPELGLPIPSGASDSLVLDSGLKFNKVATLAEVASNDAVLRKLDLEGAPFPATSKDFEKVVAYVPSTPFVVSARMIPMEQEFSGSVNTVLSTSFAVQKERIAEIAGIVDVKRLHEANEPILEQALFPFESDDLISVYMTTSASKGNLEVSDSSASDAGSDKIEDYTADSNSKESSEDDSSSPTTSKKSQTAPLWIAKVLYLRGKFVDEGGAGRWFLQGRISDRLIKQEESSIPERVKAYVAQYVEWKASRQQTPSQEEIQAIVNQAASEFQREVEIKRFVKALTSFDLATLSEANGNDKAALERLNDDSLRPVARTDSARAVVDELRQAASYLRARILEKQGSYETAIDRYRLNVKTPGALIRARWIAELAGIKITSETPEQQDATQENKQTEISETPDAVQETTSESAPQVEATPTETTIPDASQDTQAVPSSLE